MNRGQLLELGKWIAAAAGLVLGAGVSAAAALQIIKQILAAVKVTLSGAVAGIIASVLTVAIVAWTLGTAQGCPWWLAILASVVAVYMPHVAYDGPAAAKAALVAKAAAAAGKKGK